MLFFKNQAAYLYNIKKNILLLHKKKYFFDNKLNININIKHKTDLNNKKLRVIKNKVFKKICRNSLIAIDPLASFNYFRMYIKEK